MSAEVVRLKRNMLSNLKAVGDVKAISAADEIVLLPAEKRATRLREILTAQQAAQGKSADLHSKQQA